MQPSSLPPPLPKTDSPRPRVNILLGDDHPGNLCALEAVLAGLGHNLVQARSADAVLRLLEEDDFAVVLLDVQMHGLDVCETARLIRGRERSRPTPTSFLPSPG